MSCQDKKINKIKDHKISQQVGGETLQWLLFGPTRGKKSEEKGKKKEIIDWVERQREMQQSKSN